MASDNIAREVERAPLRSVCSPVSKTGDSRFESWLPRYSNRTSPVGRRVRKKLGFEGVISEMRGTAVTGIRTWLAFASGPRWSGPLKVSLPGRPNQPLAGKSFLAVLDPGGGCRAGS